MSRSPERLSSTLGALLLMVGLQQPLFVSLEDLIGTYVSYLTFAIDIAAGVIIGISAILALVSYFRILPEPVKDQTVDKETIRLRLARGLLLALDFEVGSDILKTILVPTASELTVLGVVVGIRIVLSWSLSKEIDKHDQALVNRGEKPIAGRSGNNR